MYYRRNRRYAYLNRMKQMRENSFQSGGPEQIEKFKYLSGIMTDIQKSFDNKDWTFKLKNSVVNYYPLKFNMTLTQVSDNDAVTVTHKLYPVYNVEKLYGKFQERMFEKHPELKAGKNPFVYSVSFNEKTMNEVFFEMVKQEFRKYDFGLETEYFAKYETGFQFMFTEDFFEEGTFKLKFMQIVNFFDALLCTNNNEEVNYNPEEPWVI